MSQYKYVKYLLDRTGLQHSNPLDTPTSSSKMSKLDGKTLSNPTLYRNVVGALQYCTINKPNIAYIVNKLCQFFQAPMDIHWLTAKRVLRYLSGTAHHGILLHKYDIVDIVGFCNVGWASSLEDRRSTCA